ncbi:MAG: hypothetical protein WC538_21110 [Thermoanaerobaculia bacterium]|jgi:hypothetical protein
MLSLSAFIKVAVCVWGLLSLALGWWGSGWLGLFAACFAIFIAAPMCTKAERPDGRAAFVFVWGTLPISSMCVGGRVMDLFADAESRALSWALFFAIAPFGTLLAGHALLRLDRRVERTGGVP